MTSYDWRNTKNRIEDLYNCIPNLPNKYPIRFKIWIIWKITKFELILVCT